MRSFLRALRSPLSITVVATLALAIGANTAVFGIVDAVLLRPPPFRDVERLSILYITRSAEGGRLQRERWSYPRYQLLRRLAAPYFDDVASFSRSTLTITDGEPEPVEGEVVAPAYFRLLSMRPLLGRVLLEEEATLAGEQPVVVIGHSLWRRRFAGDSGVVGRSMRISGVPFTIVGVMPEGAVGLTGRGELWIPPTMAPRVSYPEYLTTNQNFISVVGRLRRGVAHESARRAAEVIGAQIQREVPSADYGDRAVIGATSVPLDAARVEPTSRQSALLLLAAVGFLLLLACANVANLLLARATSRRRELAVRAALGATRGQLARITLLESLVLTGAGGALGGLLAVWLLPLVPVPTAIIHPRNMYGSLGDFAAPAFDWRVGAFVILVSVIAAFLCGALPALAPSRLDLTRDLKDGAPAASAGAGLRRLSARSVLVGVETALALLLLVSAGLMLESFRRLRAQPIGFEPERLMTFWLRPPDVKYPPPQAAPLIERTLAEIARLPEVEAASVDGCTPLGTGCANSTLYVVGRPLPAPNEAPGVLRHYVGPDHFRALGVPLIRGRVFTPADRAGRPRVAIINQLAARRFFAGEDPIGQRVWFGGGSTFDRPDSAAEIVGIVGDVAHQALDERPVQPDFYTSYLQFTYASRAVLVRARAGDPARLVPALRRAVRNADPDLALYDVRTMAERIGESWARRRLHTILLAGFAAVAILLSAMGIYAIVAHSIALRTREVGIRVALGATMSDVVGLLVREGMAFPAIGLAVGVAGALLLTRALSALLYGVAPTEPAVYVAVTVLLAFVALVACYLPARRVLRIDPLVALKSDA